MKKGELFHKNLLLSHEFDLYVLEHPEVLDEIPDKARIVLLPEEDPELTEANLRLLGETHEAGQTVVFIHLRKLKPITSRITKFDMEISKDY